MPLSTANCTKTHSQRIPIASFSPSTWQPLSSLGKLDAGNCVFEVHVKTVHGSRRDPAFFEKKAKFNIVSCETILPEFSSSVSLSLMLILTATFVLVMHKKFLCQLVATKASPSGCKHLWCTPSMLESF